MSVQLMIGRTPARKFEHSMLIKKNCAYVFIIFFNYYIVTVYQKPNYIEFSRFLTKKINKLKKIEK